MFKLLGLSCLLLSCLADPLGHPSWSREAGHPLRPPRGCSRAEGWRACARVSSTTDLAPHAHDCSLFFYCSGGARPACRRCPGGLHFNPDLQVCDWPENVNCTARPPRPFPCHNGTTPLPATVPDNSSTSISDMSTTTAPLTDSTIVDDTTTSAPSTDSTIVDDTTTNALLTDITTADDATTSAPSTDSTIVDDTTTNALLTDSTTADDTTTNAPLTDSTIVDDTTIDALLTNSTTVDNTTTDAPSSYNPTEASTS